MQCIWEIEDTAPPIKHGPDSKPSSSAASTASNKAVKVSFLTEQTSHHPPVSAFFVDCPEKGIIARGFDQLSAKFTGTSIRVIPGAHNLGIFIELKNREGEQYQLTHPAAHLGGLLRGARMIARLEDPKLIQTEQAPSVSPSQTVASLHAPRRG